MNPDPDLMIQLYFILAIAGLFLIGAEIFVPGGILGVMGGKGD